MSATAHCAGLLLGGFARALTGVSVRWVDCLPATRQRIYFANHGSHLDIIVLWASLPPAVRRLTRPAGARDYWTGSALRRYLACDVLNTILIDRADHSGSVRDAARGIATLLAGIGDTHSLIIFPEGTRRDDSEPGPFKGGLFALAEGKPGIELVPVYLENLNRILPKGEFIPVPVLSSLSFGPPLSLRPGEKKHAFLDRARQAILALRET